MDVDLAAIGAFLSGAAAVVSSVWAARRIRGKAEADCRQRIEEVKQAIREGFQMREEK